MNLSWYYIYNICNTHASLMVQPFQQATPLSISYSTLVNWRPTCYSILQYTYYTQTGRSPSHVGIRIDLDLVVPQRNLQTKCQVHCANAKWIKMMQMQFKCSALHLVWFQTVPDDLVAFRNLAAGSAAVGRCFLIAGLESSRLQGTKFAALKTMWYDGILMGL